VLSTPLEQRITPLLEFLGGQTDREPGAAWWNRLLMSITDRPSFCRNARMRSLVSSDRILGTNSWRAMRLKGNVAVASWWGAMGSGYYSVACTSAPVTTPVA
jgi:hypothetical protein